MQLSTLYALLALMCTASDVPANAEAVGTEPANLEDWPVPEENAVAHQWLRSDDGQIQTIYLHNAVNFTSIPDVHSRDDGTSYKDGWKGPDIVEHMQCDKDSVRFENLTGIRGNGDAFRDDCDTMIKYMIEHDAIWDLAGGNFASPGNYVNLVWHGKCAFGISRLDNQKERVVINTIDIANILTIVLGSKLKFVTQSVPRKVEADGFMTCDDNPVAWSVYNKDALDQDQVDHD